MDGKRADKTKFISISICFDKGISWMIYVRGKKKKQTLTIIRNKHSVF